MQKVTGTLIWYYFICKRQVWLMAHEINPFQNDPFLEIGRILHSESYKKEKKEIAIEEMKFDILKRKENESIIISEIKKSSRFLESATMQLCYYLYRLSKKNINVCGEILIPLEKKKIKVEIDNEKIEKLKNAIYEIKEIMNYPEPPKAKRIGFCKNCAYAEFCFS